MATITLNYNARNSQINKLIEAILTAGAKIAEPQKTVSIEKNETLKAYQKMFGKRKDNKYTDNEIFVFNSMRNVAPILERYED
jgi:hypothetical protein